jgi:hypothetical protein
MLLPPFLNTFISVIQDPRNAASILVVGLPRSGWAHHCSLGEVGLEKGQDLYHARFLIARIATSFKTLIQPWAPTSPLPLNVPQRKFPSLVRMELHSDISYRGLSVTSPNLLDGNCQILGFLITSRQ